MKPVKMRLLKIFETILYIVVDEAHDIYIYKIYIYIKYIYLQNNNWQMLCYIEKCGE